MPCPKECSERPAIKWYKENFLLVKFRKPLHLWGVVLAIRGFVVKGFPEGNSLGLLPFMLVIHQLPACPAELPGSALLPYVDGYMSSPVLPFFLLNGYILFPWVLFLWQFATFSFILNCRVNLKALNDYLSTLAGCRPHNWHCCLGMDLPFSCLPQATQSPLVGLGSGSNLHMPLTVLFPWVWDLSALGLRFHICKHWELSFSKRYSSFSIQLTCMDTQEVSRIWHRGIARSYHSTDWPLSPIHSPISFVSKVKVEALSPSLLITQASHHSVAFSHCNRVFKFYLLLWISKVVNMRIINSQ